MYATIILILWRNKKFCVSLQSMDKSIAEDIKKAVDALRRGGVILYPTDTVWGIGCDANNDDAVSRIFSIKHRNDSKALITLVADKDMLIRTVDFVPDAAMRTMAANKRPVTIIYDSAKNVSSKLKADDGSLGVRIVQSEFAKELCRQFGGAVTSTSANISGQPTPAVFDRISQEIIDAVDYVCTSERTVTNATQAPSKVIRIHNDNREEVIRP